VRAKIADNLISWRALFCDGDQTLVCAAKLESKPIGLSDRRVIAAHTKAAKIRFRNIAIGF
jgi:hypothetical protein